MRILVLHSRYRSGPVSGENRVVDDEATLLSQAGHDVEVVAPSLEGITGVELLRAGVRVVWSREAAAEVRARIRRFRPDVVHAHNLFPALSPSVLRAVGHGVPLVMTLHNYRLHCLPGVFLRDGRICQDCFGRRAPWPGVVHRCYQGSAAASLALATSLTVHRRMRTFDTVDRFLAISAFIRDRHVEGGIPAERVTVKRHFVWPQERRRGPGEHFLFLGRLAPEKGVDTLLRAWRDVDAKLIVAGDGPEAGSLRALAPPNVEFTSTVSPKRVRELLLGARALAVPSVWYEGFGRVVVEAYASGVPVLASQIGALPEVVEEGISGLLLPPGNPGAWSDAARRLLPDDESERLGEAAYEQWSTRYTPEIGLTALEETYRTVTTP